MKKNRQTVIKEIITGNEVSTQEQLMELLEAQGIVTTQATLSRDMREMKLTKKRENGIFRYVVPSHSLNISGRNSSMIRQTVIKVDRGGQIVVLHTHPGMANAAAAAIDGNGIGEILGTIAGDDTIFVLLKSEEDAADFAEKVEFMVSEG